MKSIIVFIALLVPIFKFNNLNINSSIITGLTGIIISISSYHKRSMLVHKFSLILIMIYLNLVFIISNTSSEFGELNKIFIYSILSLYSAFFVVQLYKNNFTHEIFYKLSIMASMNIIISIFFFIYPNSIEFLSMFFQISNQEDFSAIDSGRSPGLSGIGGANLSILYGTLASLLIIKLSFYNNKIVIYMLISIIVIGIVLTGRLGWIPLFITISFFLKRKMKHLSSKVIIKLFFLFLLIFISYNYTSFEKIQQTDSVFSSTFYRATEPIRKFREEGRLSTSSSDILFEEHYFLPDNLNDLLWGEGNFGRSNNLYRIPSDVMFIRIIYGVGIVGLILMLIPYVFLINKIVLLTYKKHRDRRVLIFLLFFSILAGFKEWFYFNTSGIIFLTLIAFLRTDYEFTKNFTRKPSSIQTNKRDN